MPELIALAKKEPGTVTWGTASTAPTSADALYIEWFKRQGVQFLAVPYKINTQAMNGAVAGEVQVVLYAIGQAARLAKSGQLRPIATVSDARSAYLPDLPTMKEQGVDLTLRSWFGLFGRAGMAQQDVRRLNAEIRRIMEDAAFREKFSSAVGLNFEPNTPEEFAAFIRDERATLDRLYTQVGVKRD
jgi:tripartite-type tricarboxylate transporter receptor subunit TctC